jgi:Uma2 family endonuclease
VQPAPAIIDVAYAERLTAEEFVARPPREIGRPWNLIDGRALPSEGSARRAHAQGEVLVALEDWARAERPGRGHAMPPLSVRLDELNVYAPDVMWYADGRLPDAPDWPAPYPMPDIAVQVRSPWTWHLDVGPKKSGYEYHGLPELWLVDTFAESVLVFRRSTPRSPDFDVVLELFEDARLVSPLLSGFALPVADVFRVR